MCVLLTMLCVCACLTSEEMRRCSVYYVFVKRRNEQKWQNPKMKLFYILTRLKTIKDIYIMNESRAPCGLCFCVAAVCLSVRVTPRRLDVMLTHCSRCLFTPLRFIFSPSNYYK